MAAVFPAISHLHRSYRQSAGYLSSVRTKDEVRREVWTAMEREGVSRFPGADGRIPNFAGAKLAAEKLAGHRLWKRARVIKANPDSPQTHARRIALEEGKTVIMAVPRLRDPHPFRVLDPKKLSKAEVREAATIKGALKHGRVVALDDLPESTSSSAARSPSTSAARGSAKAAAITTSSTGSSSTPARSTAAPRSRPRCTRSRSCAST